MIAHEILEALARGPLSGRELRIILLILRESYGRQRKDAALSLREIQKRTGIAYPNASRAISEMRVAKVITVTHVAGNDNRGKSLLRFQKDYHQWSTVTKRVVKKITVIKVDNGSVIEPITVARTRVNKERKEKTSPQPAVAVLVNQFFDRLKAELGESPVAFPRGMVAANFKQVLKSYPADKIAKRISHWFDSTDPFVLQNRWAPGLFFKRFNALANGPLSAIKNGHPIRNLIDEGWVQS